MSIHANELPIPDKAIVDPQARELVRVWAAGGAQQVVLATGLWEDPAAWGLMLVDLMKHVANGYAQSSGQNREQVLARIREGFEAEWESPTDQPEGELVD